MDKPTVPGLYWAKTSSGYEWWNLIVEVYGESPYLAIKVIANRAGESESAPGFDVIGPRLYPPSDRGERVYPICADCSKQLLSSTGYWLGGHLFCRDHTPEEVLEFFKGVQEKEK